MPSQAGGVALPEGHWCVAEAIADAFGLKGATGFRLKGGRKAGSETARAKVSERFTFQRPDPHLAEASCTRAERLAALRRVSGRTRQSRRPLAGARVPAVRWWQPGQQQRQQEASGDNVGRSCAGATAGAAFAAFAGACILPPALALQAVHRRRVAELASAQAAMPVVQLSCNPRVPQTPQV